MKAKSDTVRTPQWAGLKSAEVQEKPYLLVLWALALTSIFPALSFLPETVRYFGWVGVASLGFLVMRLVFQGMWGYEREVGLRILSRYTDRSDKIRSMLRISLISGVAAAVVLILLQPEVAGPDLTLHPKWENLVSGIRFILVAHVSLATFATLMLIIASRFSVFGTTSISGVVLGVAALVVVQSVATGFQHAFERRVLGVYAHVNVTPHIGSLGISEYRRFENWLATVPGVEGVSPFVYHSMVISPHLGVDVENKEDDLRLASVMVKGINPDTAGQVGDVLEHLEVGSGRPIPLSDLRSDHVLTPIRDRDNSMLPPVIADTPDPRGAGAYEAEVTRVQAYRKQYGTVPKAKPTFGLNGVLPDADESDWLDAPEETDAPGNNPDAANLPTVFIGHTLADRLKLAIHDRVLLVEPGAGFDHTEVPRFKYYKVAGIFEAGFQEYDQQLIYVNIKELQGFKWRDEDLVSGIDLRLTEPSTAPVVGKYIRESLQGEYRVLEWQILNRNLFASIETQKALITIVLSLVIFVASFNVLSALWTMVVRRTPEIAIMMSMGSTGPQVARVFQVSGMTIGIAGSIAGVILGLVLCGLVQLYGYTLDPEVYFIEELPVEISLVQIAWVLAMTLGICFIATIPPAMRAAKLRPVEGLRYE